MNKKNKIIYLTGGIALFFGLFLWINKGESIDVTTISTEVGIRSEVLISKFRENEELANSMYTEKVIEISGVIKEITFLNNRTTIVLYGNDKGSYILCDMQSSQKQEVKDLKKDQNVSIKGICKGFLKDVIVLNCILINKKMDE
ncbi:OB-fold protein [Aquimarina pacifica]|uniref:OB-fold protein n=1 Tax=Aquimarina pacifica TaxID=1296415 RepID=UPI000471B6D0|nr:hypothetical protein [Aquimarina pacifica]